MRNCQGLAALRFAGGMGAIELATVSAGGASLEGPAQVQTPVLIIPIYRHQTRGATAPASTKA
jgi:hypothetical protein